MTKYRKGNSDASTPGPPPGELLAVNTNRKETPQSRSTEVHFNDDSDLKSSRRSVSNNDHLKANRRCLTISTWNVRTLYMTGKLDNLIKEAAEMDIDTMGVAETHWNGDGIIYKEDHIFIYSGGEEHKHGVDILLKKRMQKFVMGTFPASERNLLVKIKAKPFNISIIQTYAPTHEYPEEQLEEYYEELQRLIKEVKSDEELIVMGDYNAKVGKGKKEDTVGHFGLGTRNEKGERLIQFCEENNLCIW